MEGVLHDADAGREVVWVAFQRGLLVEVTGVGRVLTPVELPC
jgi:hypothetical protein